MHKFLSLNHKIQLASQTFLPAVSSAALYGRGIFTSIAIYNSKPFQWAHHWQRLIGNAKTIGIDLSAFSEDAVKNSLSEIIKRNNLENGRVRITFFDDSASGIWKSENEGATSFLIMSADFRPVPDNLRLAISPYQINSKSPLVNVKSCNYLENLLVLEEAAGRGFDEAIRLNEKNEIVSTAMANVFWTFDGIILTPALETGALGGATRGFILENFPVLQKRASIDELKAADEVFLASAGIGIARVKSVEKRNFEQTNIFQKIRKFFDEFTRQMS
jgi:branched-subunit amino acid aminotransferase/4-amino-4-deoxychorismate lyase